MVAAEVVKIIGRTGIYGEVIQVMCKILDGPEKGRVKRRNIIGNAQKGDVLVLLSTEREAKEIKGKK